MRCPTSLILGWIPLLSSRQTPPIVWIHLKSVRSMRSVNTVGRDYLLPCPCLLQQGDDFSILPITWGICEGFGEEGSAIMVWDIHIGPYSRSSLMVARLLYVVARISGESRQPLTLFW